MTLLLSAAAVLIPFIARLLCITASIMLLTSCVTIPHSAMPGPPPNVPAGSAEAHRYALQFNSYLYHDFKLQAPPQGPQLSKNFGDDYRAELAGKSQFDGMTPKQRFDSQFLLAQIRGYQRILVARQAAASSDQSNYGGSASIPNASSSNSTIQNAADGVVHTDNMLHASDRINWIQVTPNRIPRGFSGDLQVSINLVGSPARVGQVYVEGGSSPGVATITGRIFQYGATQNMVNGLLRVNASTMHSGAVTITATVQNYRSNNAVASTTLYVQ